MTYTKLTNRPLPNKGFGLIAAILILTFFSFLGMIGVSMLATDTYVAIDTRPQTRRFLSQKEA